MQIKRIAISIFILAFAAACSDEDLDPAEINEVIIEGYLYAGASIDSMKVSQLIPFITDEDESYEITDANVNIRWAGNSFKLTPSQKNPGNYIYEDTDLRIVEGETYELNVEYFDKSVTASTTVPARPVDLEISMDTLEIEPIDDFQDIFNQVEAEALEIYWSNDVADYYYVLLENIEADPEEINTLDFDGFGDRNFSFVTEPTNLDFYNVNVFSLTQYGTYRAVVFHVSQEYVDLYETAEQDSRNLTEPLSNIENGLGIFTSFSSDTIYFEIVKP